ncbi:MAG: AAA family ATPase [Dongiaceae bacterium]
MTAIRDALKDVTGARVEARNGALADMFREVSSRRRIDMMILDVDLTSENEIDTLTRLIDQAPRGLPIIATSPDASIDRVRLLMRLGLADFVPQPIIAEDLLNSISVAWRQAAQDRPRKGAGGKIIAFIRPSGGMGATTLAVQSAWELAQKESGSKRVCLIDLDMQGRNAALYLDIESPLSVVDCLVEPERIDTMMLQGVVTHHKSGFDVIPAPQKIMSIDAVRSDSLEAVLEAAREEYDFTLLDMPPVWTSWTDMVLTGSDVIVLVTQMTVAGIRQARRQIDTLVDRNLGHVPLLVVANRYEKRLFGNKIDIADAERALGRPVDAFVSSDYKLVSEALNAGIPISEAKRGNKIEKQVRKLIRTTLRILEESSGAVPQLSITAH